MQTAFPQLRPALKSIALCLPLLGFANVHAQQGWPNRPIRLLVPYPPGGSTDILTHLRMMFRR